MAKSGNGSGGDSWPGFLSELTKSFLILRDVFGYALPGGVFLSIGVLCKRFSLSDIKYLLDPYQLPAWLAVLVGLAGCYAVGHVMAGIAYLFFNQWKVPFVNYWKIPFVNRWWSRFSKWWKSLFITTDDSGKAEHAQVPKELIDIRGRHPELLTELERQSTMTHLRGATGVAMLLGYLLFYRFSTPSAGLMLGLAGVFLLVTFWFSAIPHIDDLQHRTIDAAKLTDEAVKANKTIDPANLKQALEDFIAAAKEALKKV